MKKTAAILLIALTVLSFSFAQGAKEAAPATSGTTEPVTISFSTWDFAMDPGLVKLVDRFQAEHPNIKIDRIEIDSTSYTQKLSIMLNGGSDVDVIMIKDADTTKSLSDKGQLADLSGFVKKDNIDLSAYNGLTKNFTMPDGKLVGMPFRSDWYIMYYNKDIFDKAGVAYPKNDWTWKDFEETAKKLTSGSGQTKTYGAHIHTWQACVQNWGVQDGKHTIMDKEYGFFKPYYEMVLRMQNTDKTIMDYATLKTGNIHYSSPFLKGQVAMMPMGTWFMKTIIGKKKAGESTINWGIATLPHAEDVPAGYTVGSATPVAINAASKKKDAAWEFVKYLTSAEGTEYYAESAAIPGRNNDKVLANIAKADGMPSGAAEALKVKNISFDRPCVDHVGDINQMLGEEHSLIMLGELSVDKGIKEMGDRAKEILGK
jgi:multiple sugar transport system substrate-binding protein